jgi:probable rRNA maturation factor
MNNAPDIALTILAGDWAGALTDYDAVCRKAALAGLIIGISNDLSLPMDRLEISLVLANDAEVQKLNKHYRGQDKPTNVLSFAALDDGMDIPDVGPILLGDVILALETTVAEAQSEGKTLTEHVSHLVVHGIMHLLGFDHEEEGEAEEMEGLERMTLAKLGLPDPYRADLPGGNGRSP